MFVADQTDFLLTPPPQNLRNINNSSTLNVCDTKVIQKISSVYEYCHCCAAATMVRMSDEFVDSVARHGRNL